jgi:hypothetical protein
MGGMPPMGNAMPNLGGYAGGTGGALTHNTHAALRQPYMSAQVLNAATAAAAQVQHTAMLHLKCFYTCLQLRVAVCRSAVQIAASAACARYYGCYCCSAVARRHY